MKIMDNIFGSYAEVGIFFPKIVHFLSDLTLFLACSLFGKTFLTVVCAS